MTDCIFCQIISGKIKSEKLYEEDDILVIKDINPKAKYHFLIIPKKHIESLQKITPADRDLLGNMLMLSQKLAMKLKVLDDGFKIVINNGKESGQIVFHMHMHFLAKIARNSHWSV
jgi:histidine triad (HIT) family protein